MTKAIVSTITYAGMTFEGLMLPDGSYQIGVSQLSALLQFPNKNASREVKGILGKGFQFLKTASELHPKKVNTLTLPQLAKVIKAFARKGNEAAWDLLDACFLEKMERIFDEHFGNVVEERVREQRFAARMMTKATFRPLTDALQETGFTEGWEYGKFIKDFQTHIGFKSGERDNLDLQTLLYLGNCQGEIKCLIKAGYEPWDALELWKEQNPKGQIPGQKEE